MTYIKLNLAQLFNVSYMGQSKFDDAFKHFSRKCEEYIFYFVKEGDLYIEEDDKKYHLTEGDYLILEPNKHHIGYKGAPVHYYFIHIKDADFSVVNGYSEAHIQEDIAKRRLTTLSSDITTSTFKEDSLALVPKNYHLDQNFELYQLLDTACHELNQKNENYKLSSVLLSMQVLIKMNRLFNAQAAKGISQKAYATVKEVIQYLEQHLHLNLSMQDIEDHMQLNYDYLNRIFKSGTGFTIKNYSNLLKIQYAQKLMKETTLTIAEISQEIGIDDPFYFSKLFKNKTGLTPTQYKNEIDYRELE